MTNTLLAIVKDGKIEPLSPLNIPEGTQISITIEDTVEMGEWTENEWMTFSQQGLAGAYSDDEPVYEIPTSAAI
jgi:predicted DNA-binding antitoxin AbrB/MazE fold protein